MWAEACEGEGAQGVRYRGASRARQSCEEAQQAGGKSRSYSRGGWSITAARSQCGIASS